MKWYLKMKTSHHFICELHADGITTCNSLKKAMCFNTKEEAEAWHKEKMKANFYFFEVVNM